MSIDKVKNLHLFTNSFPFGKQETFLEDEIETLSEHFEKIYLHPLRIDKYKRELPPNCITVTKSRYSLINISNILPFFKLLYASLLELLNWKTFSIKAIKKILKQVYIILNFHKDISKFSGENEVLYFYWGTNLVSSLYFVNTNIKKIVRMHRYDLYEHDHPHGEYQPFRKKILKKVDYILPISLDGEKYLTARYPFQKTLIHRLGVREIKHEKNMRKVDGFHIVSCSNIIPVKRVELLAMALSHLNFNLTWTHFGDGDENLKLIIMDITDRASNITFDFKGRRPKDEVIQFYKENYIDLFVNVSSHEGVPVSIMEAMAAKIPVIATDVGGTAEIFKSLENFIIPEVVSTKEISKKIQWFHDNHLNNQELRKQFHKNWDSYSNANKNYKLFSNFLLEL